MDVTCELVTGMVGTNVAVGLSMFTIRWRCIQQNLLLHVTIELKQLYSLIKEVIKIGLCVHKGWVLHKLG